MEVTASLAYGWTLTYCSISSGAVVISRAAGVTMAVVPLYSASGRLLYYSRLGFPCSDLVALQIIVNTCDSIYFPSTSEAGLDARASVRGNYCTCGRLSCGLLSRKGEPEERRSHSQLLIVVIS